MGAGDASAASGTGESVRRSGPRKARPPRYLDVGDATTRNGSRVKMGHARRRSAATRHRPIHPRRERSADSVATRDEDRDGAWSITSGRDRSEEHRLDRPVTAAADDDDVGAPIPGSVDDDGGRSTRRTSAPTSTSAESGASLFDAVDGARAAPVVRASTRSLRSSTASDGYRPAEQPRPRLDRVDYANAGPGRPDRSRRPIHTRLRRTVIRRWQAGSARRHPLAFGWTRRGWPRSFGGRPARSRRRRSRCWAPAVSADSPSSGFSHHGHAAGARRAAHGSCGVAGSAADRPLVDPAISFMDQAGARCSCTVPGPSRIGRPVRQNARDVS